MSWDLSPNLLWSVQISPELSLNLVSSQSKFRMISFKSHQSVSKSRENSSKSSEISSKSHALSPTLMRIHSKYRENSGQTSWEPTPNLMRSRPNLDGSQSKSHENSVQISWDLFQILPDLSTNLMRSHTHHWRFLRVLKIACTSELCGIKWNLRC